MLGLVLSFFVFCFFFFKFLKRHLSVLSSELFIYDDGKLYKLINARLL